MNTILPHTGHILLADDDKDHGILFSRALAKVAPEKKLFLVHDGEALLRQLPLIGPELLFLDLNMPCKHGLECLREIKNNESLQQIPVVVYSSSTQMTDIQRSYLNKADLYMVKPFQGQHLQNALQSILNMDWKQTFSINRHYFINNRFVPYTA
jgi:CheY-like chemotaxis protein